MPDTPNPVASDVVAQPSPQPQTQQPDVNAQFDEQPVQQFNPASGMGGPTAQPGRGGANYAAPVPTPAQAQLAKQVKTGLGWHSLMGTHTEYQQGPNGPVATPVQNSPGQLFKSILAGAIMGMAGSGGADNAGSGWAAAGRGAGAARQGREQQQEQARQQAQQEWQNSLTAQKEEREKSAFETEQQVRKAQIAQANQALLQSQLLLQGTSYAQHKEMEEDDTKRASSLVDAGVKPLYDNTSESEMNDILGHVSGASSLKWFRTGTKTVLSKDANGNDVPNYESTFTAYDPNTKIPLSAATIKQWEDDGLFKYHPEYKDTLQPGKTLKVNEFVSVNQAARTLDSQNFAKNKDQLELDHLKAQIDEAHAAVKAHNASAAESGLNLQEKRDEISRRKEEDTAWAALAAVGNDPNKLTDAHQRTILARSVKPLMDETISSIRAAAAEAQNNDAAAIAELPQLWKQYNAFAQLASLAPKGSAEVSTDPAQAAADRLKGKTPQEVQQALNDPKNNVPVALKPQIWKKLNMEPPSMLSPLGKATASGLQTVVPAVQGVL